MPVVDVLHKSLMITAFVAVMMLAVEYFNVQTRGVLLATVHGARWRQYLVAAALGAIPGCLGAYAVVALYAHRRVTLGALVAAMIATSGDETFVMLALFPKTALMMTLGLAAVGIAAGWLSDVLLPARWLPDAAKCRALEVHAEAECRCYPRGEIVNQWRTPSPYRATLVVALALFVFAIATGHVGPVAWSWKRISLLAVTGLGLFIASTVPEHFLEQHLWRHVAVRHVPRVFAWTTGALGLLAVLNAFVDLPALVSSNPWQALAAAAGLGILPESGPHLVFVTMFADGAMPLSILVASSIVQDGHGMLPLLATSKRAFALVKLLNVVSGVAVGGAMLALGY
ncbi:MAG: arsenic efflux protein [Polyangiaceae bacterium]|nr:arsenic efflux protein [Polyangiaceae bacterium]